MEYESKTREVSEPNYQCLLFDVDDTLYPICSGLSNEVTKNIQEYMIEKLRIEVDKVPELCDSLYKHYGTTMAGLKAMGYDFDTDDFHSFVHERLPYTMLKPDPLLRSLLLSVPVRKIIFTNADKSHAERVLSRLGLEDCFEGIISFETLNPPEKVNAVSSSDIADINDQISSLEAGLELPKTPVVCKPFEDAFEQVFKIANLNPHKTLFFDDSIRNIQTGKRLGLHTVLVGTSHRGEGIDVALEHVHNIREAFPELWEAEEKSEDIWYREEVPIEAYVQA